MVLRLGEVQSDPIADRALKELVRRYTVEEEESRLVLTHKVGEMKLFLHDLDDLHQWDFVHNQKMASENERLRSAGRTLIQQRNHWKRRALAAEAQLSEGAADPSEQENAGDDRYAALKRYLAKRFHPDQAPGHGLEKVVRSEVFKEIWGEIDRLDHQLVSIACDN